MRRVYLVGGEMEQYLVCLDDGTQTYVMPYDVIVNSIDNQLVRESEQSEYDQMCVLNKLLGHRNNRQQWDVLMK